MFNFRLSFDSPGWLALLGLLPVLWWLSFRSLAALGNVRRVMAIAVRSIVLLLVIAALAELQWKRISDRVTVMYLLDQSLSVPEQLKPLMVDYVRQEILKHRDKPRGDRAGAIVFGGEPAIEHPPYDEDIPLTYNTETRIDREHTNIAAALRLAQATFPEDSSRRVVVLTDGNQNVGDGLEQARVLAESGIGIDVVPIRYQPRAEVVVEKVTIPPDIHKGQPFDLRVVLNNVIPPDAKDAAAVKGRLKITRKTRDSDQVLADDAVMLEPGKKVFTIRENIENPDFYTYEAEFFPDDVARDPVKQNKRATAFTNVRGQGQVLLIEDQDERGQFDYLVDRLRHENLQVTVQSSRETFSSLAELQPFDTVVLADAPAEGFTEEQMKMLVRNTQQMGAGLVMLGGPNSFGAGGWTNTPVEEAMPVDFQIKNSKVVPVGALAMLMHASEMAQGNYWQKKIAQEAIKSLGSQDYCGVLHWEGTTQWLWSPMMAKVGPLRERMHARVDKMQPGDMPDFDGPMRSAVQAFGSVPDAAVKHMIIISDGDPGPPTNSTLAAFKNLQVTISTVAIGAHQMAGSNTLSSIASATGGKYYVIQANQTAQLLPRIYQKEARSVSRPLVYEREPGFQPQVKFPHEMIQGLGADFPALTGYVLTSLKESPLVEVALTNPVPVDDAKYNTLLAGWTYGLGKAVAFTSDAGRRWATAWTSWPGYDKLFSQIVRWSMRPAGDQGKFTLITEAQDGKVRLVVTALDKDDDFLNFLNMSASAVGPDMKPIDAKISQIAPGRYVGEFDAKDAGSYMLMLSPGAGMSQILTGVNVPYSAEFLDREPNEEFLRTLASLAPRGGQPGVVIQEPRATESTTASAVIQKWLDFNTFRRDLPEATSSQAVWHLAALFAACLFLADVFIRRVHVSFTWAIPLAKAAVRTILRRPAEVAPSPVMARLRSRKAEVTQSLEQRRAAARFEPAPDAPIEPARIADALSEPLDKPKTDKPAGAPIASDQPSEEDTYTGRLLKAKKKAWKRD
ncbi:MAG TPA: glutamine amidotransferase [Pirellulales bacterium]|nr:glutamine amidotransferase [Pirellulales bacterium]